MNNNDLTNERHHEIDALRVLVLLLLIPFHSLIGFSPFGKEHCFIPQNDQLLDWSPYSYVTNCYLAYSNSLCRFRYGRLVFIESSIRQPSANTQTQAHHRSLSFGLVCNGPFLYIHGQFVFHTT